MKTEANKKSGQILLIVVLVATLLMTIGLSLTQITVDDTKIAKLEEEGKKARAAAEAGIEVAIDQLDVGETPIQIGDIVDNDMTGQAELTTTTTNSFTTPLISKDGLYMFYLTGYDATTKQIISTAFNDDIIVNVNSPKGTLCGTINEFALELTFVNKTRGIVSRKLIEESGCNVVETTNGIDEVTFGEVIPTLPFSDDPHLLITRIIAPNDAFTGVKLDIVNATNNSWPIQGRTIISTATSPAGVTKKIKLFQSFPQFPAEFFITSF
ncbi:hypothetical protein A3H80_00765 [Candidatus Roizmanbacteria bacterium RIFCSPLOWO2_02_FULL_37_19]|uniref:Uncharacterized protein n=1 Tax=Candidatus Roizmanbacteria bacterium RIFCSPHIGHO2_02_FULL_37_24 TaxID=1802037 RepID=A0A1F7GUG8_9BACT|nr:MAG: hypothetical protein A2862_00450 [Candidatus Roizmanbacteria bacterium RIFCSPHIGHO2_01_FULL_38_41]OGK22669.1 MAG: hypothetical protein A3C24_00570 [Candidatus Roizmanbacteria bacterium RIFCSPHIGHO2_02_FULL_37_24]OGK32519.1 MAG: hypothetical protein A3E10_00635 [Candidatus Roizmanbacteria bacterium RIFCSPHIGHO2_12_FULL_37_23]OGK45133.1 MAG: hypothetical protein A2956_03035 [Candidatus Roizmanbacteria bacterium RIFCSPLOWO2_01_FULL_37_57]OGK54499.1 MAG: hypothetical protein A3H80_00765 [Ca